MRIEPVDWIIFGLGCCFFLGWAIFLNHKTRSIADYLVAGRKVRMWLGMGAGIGGEIGLITIAAYCEQGYRNGFSFVLINLLSMVIVVPLFGIFGFGIERFRATRCMSVPQYLEMRYSKKLRVLVGIVNCFAGVLQMCVFPIGGAIFVRHLLGAPELVSLGYFSMRSDVLIMLILLICPVIFCTLGGYTTLIVTNFFQGILVMFTMTWLLIYVLMRGQQSLLDGMQALWAGLETHLKEPGLNPFAQDDSAYGIQWFVFLNVMTILLQFSYGPYLQQYASMDKPKTVSRSYLLGNVFGFGRALIIFGLGVAAVAALGTAKPSNVAASAVEWRNAATPFFLASIGIPPVLLGLLLLSLLFADVAVTDKYILSWSTSIVNDCIYPFRKERFTPAQQIWAVRITILVLCIIFFLFGLIYTPAMAIWSFMWLTANLIGGSGIVVLLGMYWPRAKTLGAYACVAVCVVVPLCDVVTRQWLVHRGGLLPWTPEQTGLYTYATGGVLMILLSLLSQEPSKFWDLRKAVEQLNAEPAAR